MGNREKHKIGHLGKTKMSHQNNESVPSEWKTLVLDYLENAMSDQQFQEMRKLIEKPAFQRLLADYAIDQSILRELTRSEKLADDLAKGLKGLPDRLGASVESPAATTTPHSDSAAKRWISGRMAIFAAISAMLLVMLTAGISLREKETLPAGIGAIQIQSVVGNVTIENVLVTEGMRLNEGALLSTDGITSFARISYDDGTSLVLAGSSAIVCSSNKGQKLIQVKRGQISASVSPQAPGKPLLIVTDTARMEVVGTNLAVSSSKSSTRLDVSEGKVKIQERSLGNQADVSAGNYAVANVGKKIEVLQQTIVPVTWKLDFEKGLLEDWQQGAWEQDGLGKDAEGNQSRGAVRQSFSPESGYYSIVSPNNWSAGDFRICENSYLQFRVKMEHPEWYQVLLMTRDGGFRASSFQGAYEYQESNTVNGSMKHLPPNEWRTIRIPLSSFKSTAPGNYDSIEMPFDQRPVNPPKVGDVAFTIIFGTQTEDRGLVIDDVSVTVEEPKISAKSN